MEATADGGVAAFVASFALRLAELGQLERDALILPAAALLESLESTLTALSIKSNSESETVALSECAERLSASAQRWAQLKDDALRTSSLLDSLAPSDSQSQKGKKSDAQPGLNALGPMGKAKESKSDDEEGEAIVDLDAAVPWERVRCDRDAEGNVAFAVSYQHAPGSSAYGVRLAGELRVDALRLIALLFEVDLYAAWLPSLFGIGVSASEELPLRAAVTAPLRRAALVHVSLPWPLPSLAIAVLGFGVDVRSAHSGLALVLRDLCEADTETLPPLSSGQRRLHVVEGGALFRPLSSECTRVSFSFTLDAGIASIPQWLVSLTLQSFAGLVWARLASAARAIGTASTCVHAQRMAQRREVYDFIKDRVHKAMAETS